MLQGRGYLHYLVHFSPPGQASFAGFMCGAQGQFCHDKMDGKGTYNFADGRTYNGGVEEVGPPREKHANLPEEMLGRGEYAGGCGRTTNISARLIGIAIAAQVSLARPN